MQKRHTLRHLAWRSGVAAVSQAMMFTGLYPLLPHALRAVQRTPEGAKAQPFTGSMRSALAEWGMSVALSTVRPAGVLPLPGSRQVGPRPVIVLHGYAMNR